MSLAELVPWRPHPEVWILVVTLVAGYWWSLRRLAPYYAPKNKPIVTRWQIAAFATAVASLWAVSDSPLRVSATTSTPSLPT